MNKAASNFQAEEWARHTRDLAGTVPRGASGIYMFVEKSGGRFYIGQSKDIPSRVRAHSRSAWNADVRSSAWHRALGAKGCAAFMVVVLEALPASLRILQNREDYWLKHFGAGINPMCLNTCPTAFPSLLGSRASLVSVIRRSEALKGRKRPEWVRKAISATKLSPDGRMRNSAANKGRIHTEEARRNMQLAQRRRSESGPSPLKGVKLSEQHRAKIIQRLNSPEHRQRMSAVMTGRVVADETRAKISATLSGVKHTQERRANQSAARKRFLATHPNPSLGRKHSEESKRKMRESRKRFLQSKAIKTI